ncbi:MAG: TIGR00366 family protein, partial [Bacilli bacterium]
WGDCWTNLIQPFWALPLLAVAKLQARDIMGYCVLLLFVEFVIVVLCLLFL